MPTKNVLFALVCSLAVTGLVRAQSANGEGTERQTAATFTGRSITALGVTKPPDRAASPAKLAVVSKRTRQEQADDAIMRGVCRRCD